MNVSKIDEELYNSIYGNPRRGNFKEIWNKIKNDEEMLRESVKVVRDKFNERDMVKGLTICNMILTDYKDVDSEAYNTLIKAVYSNEDIARIVMSGASNGGFSYLLLALFNHDDVLTESQKAFAVNEAMNKIGTTRYLEYKEKYFKKPYDMHTINNMEKEQLTNVLYLFDSTSRTQAHGTGYFDIRYYILRNPNWSKEEKQKLVMDFWYSDKEYKKYLEQWEWGIVNDEANYKDSIVPLFPRDYLYDLTYETLLKFYDDKETTDRIWEEIKFCELIRELRPFKYEEEYQVQKTKRA